MGRRQLLEQRRRARRQFGRLDHHAVARRQSRERRAERQLNWIVPRRDDADDAERLRRQAIAPGKEVQVGGDGAVAHPPLQPPPGVPDAGAHDEQLGEAGLLRGAMAEVVVDGGDDRVLALLDEGEQSVQPLDAGLPVWIPVGGEGAPLRFEARGDLGEDGRRQGGHDDL